MALNLSRPYHLNVNCSSLERSLGFWQHGLGLTPLTRTTPAAPQPGAAFGLEEAWWDAWILQGDAGMAGVVLDLLEWKVPAPAGRPAGLTEQGFSLVGVSVPDLDATLRALADAGSEPVGTPGPIGGSPPVAVVPDPDGTLVELVERPQRALTHVVVGCLDLEATRAWYERVLGAGVSGPVRPVPVAAVPVLGLDAVEGRSCDVRLQGAEFDIVLREWKAPAPAPRPPRAANELGIFRHALFSDDISADHRRLEAMGVPCLSPPAALDMGPGLPGDLLALLFHDPEGACLELIQPPGRGER